MQTINATWISKRTGYSLPHVSRVMRGERDPSFAFICTLGRVLEIPAWRAMQIIQRAQIEYRNKHTDHELLDGVRESAMVPHGG